VNASQETEGTLLQALLRENQQPGLDEAAQLALSSSRALDQILEGIVSKDEVYRYNCRRRSTLSGTTWPTCLPATTPTIAP
jgi:hypothetical protein